MGCEKKKKEKRSFDGFCGRKSDKKNNHKIVNVKKKEKYIYVHFYLLLKMSSRIEENEKIGNNTLLFP